MLEKNETEEVGRRDALLAAGITLGAALVVAGIMVLLNDETGETIGLVMSPAVLGVGTSSLRLRGRSRVCQIALIAGPLAITFLIGWAAALIVRA